MYNSPGVTSLQISWRGFTLKKKDYNTFSFMVRLCRSSKAPTHSYYITNIVQIVFLLFGLFYYLGKLKMYLLVAFDFFLFATSQEPLYVRRTGGLYRHLVGQR